MGKNYFMLMYILFWCSCNQSSSDKSKQVKIDTIKEFKVPEKRPDTAIQREIDSLQLMVTATRVLTLIQKKDFIKLYDFIHPQKGIFFSRYAYVDTSVNNYTRDEILALAKNNKKINWHTTGETDRVELMTIGEYFSKYVYDVDFLNAPEKTIDGYKSRGTELNNLADMFPGDHVVEFYFAGFEKKYEGMDYRALRLVFKMQDNFIYLVAIVHEKWTP